MSEISSIRRLADAGMARTLGGAPGLKATPGSDAATKKLEGARIEGGQPAFQDELKSLLSDVNALQIQAGARAQALAAGSVTDLHEVMLAQEEASVAFKLVLEMRNRIIAAYQEIMRMPV